MSEKPEENNSDADDQRNIHIHLDGKDFEGFGLRMGGVVLFSILVRWLSNIDGWLIFLVMGIAWLLYFSYRKMRFKEEAYQQIIQDLEDRNDRLDKSNKLLQNAVKDSLGMKVSTEDKSKPL